MKRFIALLAALPLLSEARAGEDFEKKVRPLLAEHCFKCHGATKQSGELRLDSREAIIQGGKRGPAAIAGKPDASLLIQATAHKGDLRMPPKEKLTGSQLASLRGWITRGLPWPASPQAQNGKKPVKEEHRLWRAFQPLKPMAIPTGNSGLGEIDRFLFAELKNKGLAFSPPADKRTLLRRACFDLKGIPPSLEEMEEFLKDTRPEAFSNAVERFLQSPQYGERWARHWLDVVRYADYHDGNPKARNPVCEPLEAWRYRDWVVQSLNRDLPFDQFIIHQIAGDLLAAPDGKQPYADGLIATTFLVNGAWDRGDADKEKMVSDMVDDQVDTVGKAFLGLTLGCARCHDHKFDPISQTDYYGLAGIFYSTRMLKELGTKGGELTFQRRPLVHATVVEKRDRQVKQIEGLNSILAEMDKKNPKPAADDPTRELLVEQRNRIQKELLPEPPLALAVSEGGVPGGLFPNIQDVPLHIRGSYTRLGPVAPRCMPVFFAGENQARISQGSGRKELAAWVASKNNPLTARVIVNRVWQWHFGQGIVATPNNFGMLSQPPSHPELLDWLAGKFLDEGWSLKKLHRRIMLSAAYQQSGFTTPEKLSQDPENRLLSRFSPRRLEAEAIRDSILAVSGKIDFSQGGPATHDLNTSRRSLYVQTARWDRSNFAMLFDAANPDASVEKRDVSTVAPQALLLLNHEFVLNQAREFAGRAARDVNPGEERVQRMFLLAFNRKATAGEVETAVGLVSRLGSGKESSWAGLAQVLLASNEFVYLD